MLELITWSHNLGSPPPPPTPTPICRHLEDRKAGGGPSVTPLAPHFLRRPSPLIAPRDGHQHSLLNLFHSAVTKCCLGRCNKERISEEARLAEAGARETYNMQSEGLFSPPAPKGRRLEGPTTHTNFTHLVELNANVVHTYRHTNTKTVT